MVRLSARSYLHLTPEHVDGDFDQPFYAKVMRVDLDCVTFRSQEGGEGRVPRSVAELHVVMASEVNKFGRVSVLRRAASVASGDQVHFGQVIAVEGDIITIASEGHLFDALVSSVAVVAPVVALLLEHVRFDREEWSTSDIKSIEESILKRVLGEDGEVGSNDLATVLGDVLEEDSHPSAAKSCHWVDPKTGEAASFPLQHALDFAYYVDGGIEPVPATVGETFCRPPTLQRPPLPEGTDGSVGEAGGLFDPFTDDDDTPQDQSEHGSGDQGPVGGQQHNSKRRHGTVSTPEEPTQHQQKRLRTALDQDALIIETLSHDPDLMHRFLSLRQSRDAQTVAINPVTTTIPSEQPAAIPATKKTASASKFDFTPREDQQRVHERVTSARHKGKSSNVYVKGLVRSEHVKFKALPGVCTRAYDIRFGSNGLSIRHFARFPQTERIAWLEAGGSNFDNLSASAEFAAAAPATCIDEVADAAKVFLTYAREFCCAELIQLVERIVEFIEETLAQVTWSLKDLSALVYWVNDVLEDFRSAAEAGENLGQAQQRCSTEDRLLRDLMFVKLHRQASVTQQVAVSAPTSQGNHRGSVCQPNTAGGKRESKRRLGKIPYSVLQQLPVQVDPASGQSRSLCMRFLSNLGCEADGDGVCPSERGHFVPKKLPALVKNEINRRFQGLKDEYKQL